MFTSIYIPRLSTSVTEYFVREELEKVIGNVYRVDFTPINKKPGFTEIVDYEFRSAFIHFQRHYTNKETIEILKKLERGESHKFYPTCILEYWILLKAKNPIQQTMMNNSQIVENCRYLEAKVEEQQETIKNLEDKLDGIHRVVYELVGGLFNGKTQAGSYHTNVNLLFPDEIIEAKDTGKWSFWPTTRQGDANESKIEKLENKIALLLGEPIDPNVFELDYQDEESVSNETHSSMPGLIKVDDMTVSTNSSIIPVFIDDDDSSVDSNSRQFSSVEKEMEDYLRVINRFI